MFRPFIRLGGNFSEWCTTGMQKSAAPHVNSIKGSANLGRFFVYFKDLFIWFDY
jgi:hypothetical protein